ncbi:MAG: radical SAM family heme chaperone HemW [Candidatus Latescibacteria bacterium]|nr:radical SAM family heme chaperone HemW [Candidatus Latescibacterota bacterium]
MSLGLYIHIPFCASRCPYCDFAFVIGRGHLSARYADAVGREIRERVAREFSGPVRFDTIFFGGGTPTAMAVPEIGRILDAVDAVAGWAKEAEITVEANPGTADVEKFRGLRRLGVNRLSIGVQSFSDQELRLLGRTHTSEEAVRAYDAARQAGFENVNIDLIFALPGQTVALWQSHLDRAIALGPEHVSVYNLTLESGTEFGRRQRRGQMTPLPEETQAVLYGAAIDRLTDAGYQHYEISNFARPGLCARHNLGYWDGSDYLGVGMSAHSFTGECRSWNVRGLTRYLERIEGEGTAIAGQEILSASERRSEAILLGLRRVQQGVPFGQLPGDPDGRRRLDRLIADDLLEHAGDRARLTRKGLMVADAVMVELIGV